MLAFGDIMSVQWIVNEVCNLGLVTSGSALRRASPTVHTEKFLCFFHLAKYFSDEWRERAPRNTETQKKPETKEFHIHWPHETECDTKIPAPQQSKKNKSQWREKLKHNSERSTKSPTWFSLTQHKSNQWNNNSQKEHCEKSVRNKFHKKNYSQNFFFGFLVLLIWGCNL